LECAFFLSFLLILREKLLENNLRSRIPVLSHFLPMISILHVHPTALSNAKRFELSESIFPRTLTVTSAQEAAAHPVLEAAFFLDGVIKLHANGSAMTVFARAETAWDTLGRGVRRILTAYEMPPPAEAIGDGWREALSEPNRTQLMRIQDALDADVRPALQRDGGDLSTAFFDGHTLRLVYQGSCRSCGFSSTSTLAFIRQTLFLIDPTLSIEVA
jgi:Fe-S cluster biogenesis protein NfuA